MDQNEAGAGRPPLTAKAGPDDRESRWPAVVAALAVGGLNLALPESLSLGPGWLLVAVVGGLLIPLYATRRREHQRLHQALGHLLSGVLTAFLVGSLALLVHSLPHINSDVAAARSLLRSAVALWATNVLVFALWYWRLDGGGPDAREARDGYADEDFLFPQMMLDHDQRAEMGETGWRPYFVDYLFLAFNTSTALSPTDTGALSRWSKILMMIQSTVSLTVVALLAARAVNIL